MDSDNNLLHIYSQNQWHSEAYIVGNQKALIELRDAIDRAIKSGNAETTDKDNFVIDGEGYKVVVIPNNKPMDDPSWADLQYPYSNSIASGIKCNENGEESGWGLERKHPATLWPDAPIIEETLNESHPGEEEIHSEGKVKKDCP